MALIIGGRHPGHYFMTHNEHNDLIMRKDVCHVSMSDNVTLARAGATSEYVGDVVLFCGGRNGAGDHADCLKYDPQTDVWSNHSSLIK